MVLYTQEYPDDHIVDPNAPPEEYVIYECSNCDRKFKGVVNPQDTGDGPLCQKCWEAEGN